MSKRKSISISHTINLLNTCSSEGFGLESGICITGTVGVVKEPMALSRGYSSFGLATVIDLISKVLH